jgi:hypothetical protein
LLNLVTQYFEAYARKDLDGLKAMWSEQSSDLAPSLKYLQRVFAASGAIELTSLNVVKVQVEGDKAFVRAALEMNVLQGKTSLVIVPDGMLWNLPFQALRSSRDKYLIEDYAVSYAPSLTVLREMMMKSRAKRAADSKSDPLLLAFGNPTVGKQTNARVKYTLMDSGLPQLPEAEKQVRTLSELYGLSRSLVYTGADASEDKAKA